jgi:hypothetical protein
VVVKVEGNIAMQFISIFIHLGSRDIYVALGNVENCGLKRKKHFKYWSAQLATSTKRKVSEVVKEFPIELNGFLTTIELNIFPLGSYDNLIGMDWLERHKAKVDCYAKVVEFHNDKAKLVEVKRVP